MFFHFKAVTSEYRNPQKQQNKKASLSARAFGFTGVSIILFNSSRVRYSRVLCGIFIFSVCERSRTALVWISPSLTASFSTIDNVLSISACVTRASLLGSETVTEEGETVWENAYPFGFLAEDNTENVVNYTVINNVDKAGAPDSEEAVANAANTNNVKDEVFKGLTIFPKTSKNSPWQDPYGATQEDKDKKHYGTPNVGIIYRVGLFNDQTINNNNDVIVHDLGEKDFVVFNYIKDYGGNSVHPICATNDEYYAQLAGDNVVYSAAADGVLNEETNLYDVTYPLYRIDTALTKISIYSQISGGDPDAVENVEAVKAVDDNWYSIDGVRVAQPTRPGLYIHGGKKIIVK